MVIRLLFFASQFFALLVQILIGCRDQTSIPTTQRVRIGFALRIAHGSRVRREVVEPRDWRVNSGWIKALPLFCVVSVRSSHTGIPSVKSTGRILPKGRPVRPYGSCSLFAVYRLLSTIPALP